MVASVRFTTDVIQPTLCLIQTIRQVLNLALESVNLGFLLLARRNQIDDL